jgi:hypothetical protein
VVRVIVAVLAIGVPAGVAAIAGDAANKTTAAVMQRDPLRPIPPLLPFPACTLVTHRCGEATQAGWG